MVCLVSRMWACLLEEGHDVHFVHGFSAWEGCRAVPEATGVLELLEGK